MLKIDRELLIFLNNAGNTSWDAFWLTVTDQHFWWWFYLLIILFLFIRFEWKKALLITLSLIIVIAINDQLINFIKHTTERLRPCNVEELKTKLRILKCSPQYSFFSAHAANSFLLATILFSLLKNKTRLPAGLILFTWASLLAYSRIYIGMHYPSDVLAGIAEGIILGLLTGKILQNKIQPNRE